MNGNAAAAGGGAVGDAAAAGEGGAEELAGGSLQFNQPQQHAARTKVYFAHT